MNTPTNQHVDRALSEIVDWKAEVTVNNLAYYIDALTHDELSLVPGKERTTRAARCDVCREKCSAGIKKFWYRSKRQGKAGSSWWFHPCDRCWDKMIESVDVHDLALQLQVTIG